MEWQQDVKDPREFRELVKVDLYPEEVYAFTPKGRVLSFPRGATPIDFAYAIHTDVGHHCSGARVNGRMVQLKTPLANGDIVEILTAPGHHPSRDWLNFVKTARARGKIRAWIHTHERMRSVALGRDLLEKEFKRYRLTMKSFEGNGMLEKALEDLSYRNLEEFQAAVGYGKVTAFQLVSRLVPQDSLEEKKESILGRAVRRALGMREHKVKVRGFEDMMIYLAKCCHPIPGDGIVGYITRGKGVSVHSVDCRNVVNLLYAPERRIDVEWESDGEALYEVTLAVHAKDQQGILARIVSTISDEKTNIRNVDAKSLQDSKGLISLSLDIKDRSHMNRVMARLKKIDGVEHVERVLR
jgi:GTP pyrophosphokinase